MKVFHDCHRLSNTIRLQRLLDYGGKFYPANLARKLLIVREVTRSLFAMFENTMNLSPAL